MSEIEVGNANAKGEGKRGWFMGHFVGGLISKNNDVEVKFSHHEAGDNSGDQLKRTDSHTLTMLVAGRFACEVGGIEFILEKEGDYVGWGLGVEHSWRALEPSTMLTVRWPSIPEQS